MIINEIGAISLNKQLIQNRLLKKKIIVVISKDPNDEIIVSELESVMGQKIVKIYFNDFEKLVKSASIDFKFLLISSKCVIHESLSNVLIGHRMSGKQIFTLESFVEHYFKRITIEQAESVLYLFHDVINFRTNRHYFVFKRLFDVFLCLLLFPFVIPILLISILGILINSFGPVFFLQDRIGMNGKVFKIYKLRTMVLKANNFSHTLNNDPRIFPFGRILRKLKIDELPQMLNVLKGEMSLIGPRPERPEYVLEICKKYPIFNSRHFIRPGITGWAQVNLPKATPFDNLAKLEYDLYYLRNQSYFLDFKILFRTLYIVITRNSH